MNIKILFDLEIKPKNPTIERDLLISLEDVLNGCTKRIKVERQIFNKYGEHETKQEIVTIDINPGTPEGFKFKFENLGDLSQDSMPADIVFTVHYKPHPIFRVNGSDIEYDVQMIESQVKHDQFQLSIPTLDGSYIDEMFRHICPENSVKRLANLGLPLSNDENNRGDLVVRFEILPNDCKGK